MLWIRETARRNGEGENERVYSVGDSRFADATREYDRRDENSLGY